MEEHKIARLGKKLLYTGLGDLPQEELRAGIANAVKEGKPDFTMELQKKYGNDEVIAKPYLRKHKEDFYFNSYEVAVKKENGEMIRMKIQVKNPDPVFINNQQKPEWINSTVTLKEAYNMACERAVNNNFVKIDKDDELKNQKYNAWQVLDFKNPNDDGTYPIKKIYGFDMKAELDQYPIKELQNEQYAKELVDSLYRGNLQSVTYEHLDGTTEKMSVKANPASKTLDLYDANMNPISLNMKRQQSSGKDMQQSESQRGEVSDDGTKAKNTASKKNDDSGEPSDDDEGHKKKNKVKKSGPKV
ncbi:hypothetical protein [Pedobacter jeongneungensis]|uniref:hypothetical protein n=1 Tax=Pedobacter jeongneungensis TaxID=947309 RepID=UPI00046A264E|nr:hypothetical protein [Pedobacter jeongneungensis]